MKKLKDIKTLCELQDFVLYGDLDKVPTSLLGPNWNPANRPEINDFDKEQILRVKMAAAIEYFVRVTKGEYVWQNVSKIQKEKSQE
jgi:hypothetical protein